MQRLRCFGSGLFRCLRAVLTTELKNLHTVTGWGGRDSRGLGTQGWLFEVVPVNQKLEVPIYKPESKIGSGAEARAGGNSIRSQGGWLGPQRGPSATRGLRAMLGSVSCRFLKGRLTPTNAWTRAPEHQNPKPSQPWFPRSSGKGKGGGGKGGGKPKGGSRQGPVRELLLCGNPSGHPKS